MKLTTKFEAVYTRYNKQELVHPDPLEFLEKYEDVRDREIAALVASSLAYGRVGQILKSVDQVLEGMNPSPYEFLKSSSKENISDKFKGFKHRFAKDTDLSALLIGIKGAIEEHGSLNACFLNGYDESDETVQPALSSFVDSLIAGGGETNLLPTPSKGSACKRLNLFLRWMVRDDEVDPGGWSGISPSKLIAPLDTHMHKIGLGLEMTSRRQGNMQTALEVTKALAQICPDDPIKYDFALTRFGIRDDMDMKEMFELFEE